MITTLKQLWKSISYLGVDTYQIGGNKEEQRRVFFNQTLFVGLLATILQVVYVWLLIGPISLIFLAISFLSIFCLYINSKGHFKLSKTLFVYFVFGMGLLLTFFLGGDGYFHFGVISTFLFSLIVFDIKTERLLILGGIPIVLLIFAVAEIPFFGAPDFSNHPYLSLARWSNMLSLFIINGILTVFLILLNKKSEEQLSIALREKEELVQELAQGNSRLESLVQERTSEISNQKNTLIRQNEEKEILLKEVHHRVKNNLQIIVSLINLQLSKFENKEVENALKETQSRVLSMSLVHKKMYQTSNFKEIGINQYSNQLIQNINALYNDIEFEYFLDIDKSHTLDVETAIPFGLIINEIVTNFFKHCDSNTSKLKMFELNFKQSEDKKFVLKYKDNGIGFHDNTSLDETTSLGLQLIASLTEQIDGEFRFYNDQGAVYEFILKI